MSILSETQKNIQELLAKVSSLEAQVGALQASEANLTAENEWIGYENKEIRKENADIVAYQEKCGVVCSQAIFDGMIDTINILKDEKEVNQKTIAKLHSENEDMSGKWKIASDDAERLAKGGKILCLENKKLKEIDHQLYSVRRDVDLCDITGLEDISELEDFVADAKKLKAENEAQKIALDTLKEEVDRLEKYNEEYKGEWEDALATGEEYKAEVEKLFKFIAGGGETSDVEVEEIIRKKMSKEFIDSNREHWDQMELFQEDDEPRCDVCNRTHDEVMYEDQDENAWNGETGCCQKCERSR